MALNPQDVHIGALGHADVAVFPARHIDVIDNLRGTIPGGCVGLVSHCNTVDGFLDDGVGVVELEDGLVTGEVQYRLALCVRQLREILVGGHHVVVAARCRGGLARQGFAGCVGPVDVGVGVVNTFHQVFDKAPVGGRVGVVVANLCEGHVHRRVLAAHLEFVVAGDLGNGGLGPSDFRHLHLTNGHLLITGHGLDGLGHCAVRLHIHGAGARDRSRSIERDVCTGKHLYLARGCRQHGIALDHDVAPDQLVLRDGLLQPCTAPRHVNTCVELDVTVGRNQAPVDGDRLAGVKEDQAVVERRIGMDGGNARLHNAIDRHRGCDQVHQLVGLDERVVVRGRCVGATRDKQLGAGANVHV